VGNQQRSDSKNNDQSKYIQSLYLEEDALKRQSRELAQEIKLENISLSQNEASLVALVLSLVAPKKVVEIGTLTGLSAQYIYQSLSQDSDLWTFEKNKEHAEKAKKVFSKLVGAESSYSELPNGKPVWTFTNKEKNKKIHLVNDDAEISLFFISQHAPFDGVFIDGNKSAYVNYLDWAEKHLKPGALVIADNVFLSGTVWGEKNQKFSDLQVQVMQEFNKKIFSSGEYEPVFIPSSDGMLIAKYLPKEEKLIQPVVDTETKIINDEKVLDVKDKGTSHV